MDFKYIGFLYSKTTYQENDCIVNILTSENESISFKAKSLLKANSKQASACNYFVLSEFVLSAKTILSNKTLKTATIIKQYHVPYEDILVSSAYFIIFEVIQQIYKQMQDLYPLTLFCFERLEEKKHPILVLNYFFKQVCLALGYAPNLFGCINCLSKKELVAFDFSLGGFICKNCFDSIIHQKLSTNILKDIYQFLKVDEFIEMDLVHGNYLFDSYIQFLKEQGGLHFQSYEFFKKINKK